MEIDDNEEMRSFPCPEIKREYEERDPISPIDQVEPINSPIDIPVIRIIPRWAQQTLQDVEAHQAPHGIHRERKRP